MNGTSAAGRTRSIFQAIRPQQWVKNILVCVPLVTSHQFLDADLWLREAIAFLSFSFCASAAYIVNDIADAKTDRLHPVKRRRPFAAGLLSPKAGLALVPLLVAGGVASGAFISMRFVGIVALYWVLTTAYSLHLKKLLLIDAFSLAIFYTLRLFGGSEAAMVHLSFWLGAFSIFLFFSLAIAKRHAELSAMACMVPNHLTRRSYHDGDLSQLSITGTVSGHLSVVVLALYINSHEVLGLYSKPAFLWPICLAVMFWVSRLWILTSRGDLPDDPVMFTLRDRVSYAVLACICVFFVLAI